MYLVSQLEDSRILKNKDQIFYLFYVFKNIQLRARDTVEPVIHAWLQVERSGAQLWGHFPPRKPRWNAAYINGGKPDTMQMDPSNSFLCK